MRDDGMMPSWARTLMGSVSSMAVWALHFALVYALVGIGCRQGWHLWPIFGSNALTLLLVVVTLPALALIAWIGVAGWRSLQQADRGVARASVAVRWRFMGWFTLALAVFAFVATLMTALPIMMLPPCE